MQRAKSRHNSLSRSSGTAALSGTPPSRRTSQASQTSTTGLLSRTTGNAAPSPPPLGPRKLSGQGAVLPMLSNRRASQTSATDLYTQTLDNKARSTPIRHSTRKTSGLETGPSTLSSTKGFIDLKKLRVSCNSKNGIARNELDAIVELAKLQMSPACVEALYIILESFKAKVELNLKAGQVGPERTMPPESYRVQLISKIDNELERNLKIKRATVPDPADLREHLGCFVGFLLAISDLASREERRSLFMKQERHSEEGQ